MTVWMRAPSRAAGIVALVLCVIAGNGGASAEAQTVTATTGAVNGVVTDSTKAVVPGVTVTLSGPSLMTASTALTDEAGAYRLSAVPLGDHTLTFQRSGWDDCPRGHPRRTWFHSDRQRRAAPWEHRRQRDRQRLGAGS